MTFGQRLAAGLKAGLKTLGGFLQQAAVILAAMLPFAALAAVIGLIVRLVVKKRKAGKAAGGIKLHLTDEPSREGVKPCANYMFESLIGSGYDEVVCVVERKRFFCIHELFIFYVVNQILERSFVEHDIVDECIVTVLRVFNSVDCKLEVIDKREDKSILTIDRG
jgi:hypothetical protein